MVMEPGNRTSSLFSALRRLAEPLSGKVKLWENARFVLVDVPLDRKEAARLLPCGMRLREPPTATLFISNYTKTSFTVPYHEAAVLIHVRTLLGSGIHCPWMIVDDDTALIYGRELLGYPKKLGEFVFEEAGSAVTASVRRRGVEVLSIELERGECQAYPQPVFDRKTFNAGGPGQMFLVQPVWVFRPREEIQESWTAKATVRLQESEYDPIARLVSGEPVRARFVVMDILGAKYNLPAGLAGPRWFAATYDLRYR
jgi:acetoacetate decarboxylase